MFLLIDLSLFCMIENVIVLAILVQLTSLLISSVNLFNRLFAEGQPQFGHPAFSK